MTEFGRRGLVQHLHARSSEFAAQGRAWTLDAVLIIDNTEVGEVRVDDGTLC